MSSDIPEEFKYLVLFAVLSGRQEPFTKTELGIKMTNPEITKLNNKERLLTAIPKGRSLHISAAPEAFGWVRRNLEIDAGDKKNKTLKLLDVTLTRIKGYLEASQVPIEEFLKPGITEPMPPGITAPAPAAPREPAAADVESVRNAYLAISGGAYDARILLKDLRKRLALDRGAQDAAFMAMIDSGEAVFYPEDDPMSRDEEDDRAALVLADRRRHVMYLHRERGHGV